MQHDYYVFQLEKLRDSLNTLEQASQALEMAKRQRDKNAQRQAENQMKQAVGKAVKIEPHLAYLWYDALKSELANSIRGAWQKELTAYAVPLGFRLLPDISGICCLPSLSFVLHILFKLQRPYLSKDEHDFYLLENPVRKEKVFQTPMVASTGWKGALRAALWQLGYKEDHEVTIRLLGNPRASDEHQAGRLYFFPTFFDEIDLEVINPHDRKTGVGARGPILMECVPPETKGELVVLYVPFGLFEQSEDQRRADVAEDLQVLAKGIRAMLTTYGFGAKTSSGFGTVEEKLDGQGKLAIRAELPREYSSPVAPPEPKSAEFPRYLESPTRLHPDLRREDGSLKSEEEYRAFVESQGRKYSKKDKQLYEKANRWWEREGKDLWENAGQEPEPEEEPGSLPAPPVTEYTFGSLSELCEVARHVAERLQGGGEG